MTKKKEEIKNNTSNKMYYNGNTKECIEQAIKMNKAVLLVGDTGSGKSSAVREIAIEQEKELIRLNLNGQTTPDEIIGKWIIKENGNGNSEMVWIDGLVVSAMRKGQWIVLDEVNAALPEILFSLHSLLDDDRFIMLKEKDGEKVMPHADFRLFATMNPDDDYAGTKELNKAFLSRFPLVLTFNYSDNEKQILIDRSKIDADVAEKMVMVAKNIREEKLAGNLSYVCSTRDIIECCNFIVNGMTLQQAVELSIVNKAPKEDREKIIKMFELLTGEIIKVSVGGRSSNSKGEVLEFKTLGEIKDYINEAFKIRNTFEKDQKDFRENKAKIEKEYAMMKETLDKSQTMFEQKLLNIQKGNITSLTEIGKAFVEISGKYNISEEDKQLIINKISQC